MINIENTAAFKSKMYAIRIVKLCGYVSDNGREHVVMTSQLLRSVTSVGTNLAEAESAISKRDFLSKVYIAHKDIEDAKYWIDLLYGTDLLKQHEYESINTDCVELIKMLTANTKTTRNSLNT